MRSFIAFDIDDEQVRRNLTRVQDILSKTGADLKLVEPKNIHVTMKFLGNIPVTIVDKIYEEMEKVAFSPFKMEIKGLGAFPNLRRPTVIWAGIREGARELRNISSHLEYSLQTLGFKPDERGFSPHLTIARVRTGRNKSDLIERIKQLEDHEIGVIEARCLRLKRSILTPKGPIYSVLREVCR